MDCRLEEAAAGADAAARADVVGRMREHEHVTRALHAASARKREEQAHREQTVGHHSVSCPRWRAAPGMWRVFGLRRAAGMPSVAVLTAYSPS